MKKIYLAGGCFWGVEEYFSRIKGIVKTEAAYSNGVEEKTNYHLLSKTSHREVVKLVYDSSVISLNTILVYYFRIIDPYSIDRQGNDIGIQYRTGIYYDEENDIEIIKEFIKKHEDYYLKKVEVEVAKLTNYVIAEDYHQKYLKKNVGAYCHVNMSLLDEIYIPEYLYKKPSEEELKKTLTQLEFEVTLLDHTEQPFNNKYNDLYDEGIYVDKLSKIPLFLSVDKFDSSCGWPSFTKPIKKDLIKYLDDYSIKNRPRIEVRCLHSDSHLGHVFDDGPKEFGSKRYCINSASIEFIKKEDMIIRNYDYLNYLLEKK